MKKNKKREVNTKFHVLSDVMVADINKGKGIFRLPPHKYVSVLTTLTQAQGWGVKQCGIPDTWTVTKGDGETALVIDTGWTDHIDIGDNCIKGKSTIPNVDNVDGEGHSTHCIGIICAKDNDTGMVGVAPNAKCIATKALSDDGAGSYDAITAALNYAIETKPSVVSMSLGAPTGDDAMYKAIKTLYDMNIPVICAAGNEGKAGVGYPAKYPETIAIAAYDENGNIADFSSRGDRVDFAAPGVKIYSTFLKNQYAYLNGTSMACPFVAGVVLLLLAKHKLQEKETGANDCQTVEQIRQHLLKYTVDKGYVGKDSEWGYGVIDVKNMILAKNDPNLPLPVYKKRNPIVRFFRNLLYALTGISSLKYK